MANSLNIGGGDDEFFRYKMPKLLAKVEGRGNGIKTRVVNCADVAKALKRPPGYVCKFFGCELGALTRINDDTNEYIVNGSHTEQALAEVLQKFIQMFVLCRKCGLPETDLKVNEKSHTIKEKCAACGHVAMCDLTHKLCNYIFNNPPPKKKSVRPAAAEGDDLAQKADAAKVKRKTKTKSGDGEEAPSDKAEKAEKKSKKKGSNGKTSETNGKASEMNGKAPETNGKASVTNGDLAAEVSKVALEDTTKPQVRQEPKGAKSQANGLAKEHDEAEDDGEEDEEEEHPVSQMINEGMGPKKLTNRVKQLASTPEKQAQLLMKGFLRDMYMEAIDGVIDSLVKALKMLETTPQTGAAICSTLDDIAENEPEIVAKLVNVLKLLYDADLVEEEHITNWHSKSASAAAKEVVAPLVQWLETAEEESEEE